MNGVVALTRSTAPPLPPLTHAQRERAVAIAEKDECDRLLWALDQHSKPAQLAMLQQPENDKLNRRWERDYQRRCGLKISYSRIRALAIKRLLH